MNECENMKEKELTLEELLLVELEDLNPYLSLLELSEETRQNFVEAMKKSLQKALQV